MGDDFSSISQKELFLKLESSDKGLTEEQARLRAREYGLNEIPEKDKRTFFSVFFSQFKSPLILILLAASILALFLREYTESGIILGILFVNSLLGFYQEYKSEKALGALKKYVSFKAKVLRDNNKVEINIKELVPGDIVFLNIGDIVPADTRILDSQELYVNESAITGESLTVQKSKELVDVNDSSISKKNNFLFMGSVIAGGLARGIVVSTGKNTIFGKTAVVLSAKEPASDFQKGINNFGGLLLRVILYITIFVFGVNAFLGKGILDSFLFAIALAVGITPELLPVIITIALSRGAIQLAEKKVIVKKLASIEDFGNIDILCTDKTGTLTENKLSLENYFDIDKKTSKEIIEYGIMCSSLLSKEKLSFGDIIDVAIKDRADKDKIFISGYKQVEEIEFDYKRRRRGIVVEHNGKRILISKGDPLSVLGVCSHLKKQDKLFPIKSHELKARKLFEELSKIGLRVIAISYKPIKAKKDYAVSDEENMVFLGFLTFADPPKDTVKNSLEKLMHLGVSVKVLTGDNEMVTKTICDKVGLEIKGRIILGSELEEIDELEFLETIENNNIFARVTPEQKFKIVSGLSKKGHVVGFLGDGVNDAPALKVADIGITVDSAVDVAKENSDVILLKKSLRVLSDGVEGGRKTFGNTMKYILNTTSANFGNMFTLAISSIYFKFIPLLPSQILLANFVSDVPLTTLPADNVHETYLKKPNKWNTKFISRFMIFFGLLSSIFDLITMAIIWFFLAPNNPKMFRTVWFTESVLSEILITFAVRTKKPLWKSKPSKLLVYFSILGVLITLFVVYFPPISKIFQFSSLSLPIIGFIVLVLFFYLVLVEIAKRKFYASKKNNE